MAKPVKKPLYVSESDGSYDDVPAQAAAGAPTSAPAAQFVDEADGTYDDAPTAAAPVPQAQPQPQPQFVAEADGAYDDQPAAAPVPNAAPVAPGPAPAPTAGQPSAFNSRPQAAPQAGPLRFEASRVNQSTKDFQQGLANAGENPAGQDESSVVKVYGTSRNKDQGLSLRQREDETLEARTAARDLAIASKKLPPEEREALRNQFNARYQGPNAVNLTPEKFDALITYYDTSRRGNIYDTQIPAMDATEELRQFDNSRSGAFERFVNSAAEAGQLGSVGVIARNGLYYSGFGKKRVAELYPNLSPEEQDKKRWEIIVETQRRMRAEAQQRRELDPTWKPDRNFGEQVASGEWIPDLLGSVVGGTGPENIVSPGSTAVRRIAAQGVIGGATNAASQGLDIKQGVADKFDISQVGMDAVASMAGQGILGEAPGAIRNYANRPKPTVDYRGVGNTPHITYDPLVEKGNAFDAITNDAFEGINKNSPFNDTPENHGLIESAKAKADAGDIVGASKDIGQLTVKKNNGLSADEVMDHVGAAIEGWKNYPGIEVHESVDSPTVPNGGVAPGTLGYYDKNSGKVHLFADQLTSPEDVVAVTFHEALGHAGLAVKYQDGLNNLLNSMFERGSPEFRKAVNEWRADPNNAETYAHIKDPKVRAAAEIEEVLAETSEKGPINKRLYDVVANYVKSKARAAGMDHLTYSDREIRGILATGHDNIINGKIRHDGADQGDLGGVRYMFQGVRSQTADLNKWNQARKMPQNDVVRRMTGWHKGDDGMWRSEIDDSPAVFHPGVEDELKANPTTSKPASEVFDHPALFEAYPHLEDVQVSMRPDMWDFNRATQGWYDPKKNELVITPYAKDPMGTALHELQHGVQDHESFSKGGNPATAMKYVDDDVALAATDTMQKHLERVFKPLENQRDAFDFAQNDPQFKVIGEKIRETQRLWKERNAIKDGPGEREATDAWLASKRESDGAFDNKIAEIYGEKNYFDIPFDERVKATNLRYFLEKEPIDQNIELNKLDDQIITGTQTYLDLGAAKKAGDADLAREALAKVEGASFQAYQALHGEAEARDTANRKDLTAEQRRMTPPMDSIKHRVLPHEYVFPERLQRKMDGMTALEISADTELANAVVYARRKSLTPEDVSHEYLTRHIGEDLAGRVRGLAKALPEQRRVPDQEVKDRALDLGVDLDTVSKYGAFQDHSDYIVGLGDLMDSTARDMDDLATAVRNKTAGPEGYAQLVQKITDFYQIASIFKESGSNIGRTLRAFGVKIGELGENFDMEGLRYALKGIEMGDGNELTPEVIEDMAERIAGRKNDKEFMKQANRLDPDWRKYASSFYYNGMLSALSPQINNIRGNMWALWDDAVVGALAVPVGKIRTLAGRAAGQLDEGAERALLREVGRRQVNMFQAIWDPETARSVVREFTAPVGGAHKNKIQAQAIKNLPASLLIEHGTRGLQAVDAFFRIAAEGANMGELAYRQAAKEAVANFGGAYGSHHEFIERRTAEIMAAPDTRLLKTVQAQADVMLLQQELPEWAQRFGKGWRSLPVVGRLTLPFYNVAFNDMRRALETSGLPATARMLSKKSRRSGAEMDKDITRMMLGLGLVTAVATGMIAADGLGPSDPQDRAQWLAGGHIPQTMIVPGVGRMSTKGLSGFGTLMNITADTSQTMTRESSKMTRKGESSWYSLGLKTAGAFVKASYSSSFASGIVDTLGAPQGNVFEKLLMSAVSPMTRIPIASEVTMQSDPYQRDMGGEDFFARVENRTKNLDPGVWTPGGRESLPIRVDPLGRLVKRLPPEEKDPIALETGRLFDATGLAIIYNRPTTKRGQPVPPDILNAMRLIEGPVMHQELTKAMADPRYPLMSDTAKARLLQGVATKVRSKYGRSLDFRLIERNPEFLKFMANDIQQAIIDNPMLAPAQPTDTNEE